MKTFEKISDWAFPLAFWIFWTWVTGTFPWWVV
jgi:hypothetical protein